MPPKKQAADTRPRSSSSEEALPQVAGSRQRAGSAFSPDETKGKGRGAPLAPTQTAPAPVAAKPKVAAPASPTTAPKTTTTAPKTTTAAPKATTAAPKATTAAPKATTAAPKATTTSKPTPPKPSATTSPPTSTAKKEEKEEEEEEGKEEKKEEEAEEGKESTRLEFLPHSSRPGLGKNGYPILLDANMFQMKFAGGSAFQYDVKIAPEVKSRQLHRKLFVWAAENKEPLKSAFAVYDGRALMYSPKAIPAKEWPLRISVNEVDIEDKSDQTAPKSKKPPRTFVISITPSGQGRGTGEIDMTALSAYTRGETKEMPRTALQALDVVMRYYSTLLYHPIGRSIFYPDDPEYQAQLGNGALLWFGHYQTVRATQLGLVLNVDLSATVVVEDLPLLDYLCARLNRRSPNELSPADRPHMLKTLRGLQVEITHRGKMKRKYRITGLAKNSAQKDTFERDGAQISVAQYFAEKYKKPLKYPFFPCVIVGNAKPISLPMEVCRVAKGQRQKQALNSTQRQRMIEETCLDPKARADIIYSGRPDEGRDPYMKAWRISVDKNMARIKGRILNAPVIGLKDEKTKESRTVNPFNGTWSLKDMSFRDPAPVGNCPVFLFGSERDMPMEMARQWMRKLIDVARYKGMNWTSKVEPQRIAATPQAVKDLFTKLAASKPTPQLVFCFLQSSKEAIYRIIKKNGETGAHGIPTQCVDWSKATHPRTGGGAYQANIALKMNAKLGGSNNIVSPALPIVSEKPTMILGADVHHPPVGNTTSPSIAAIVGSYNSWGTKYMTIVQEQGHRVEYISGMASAVKTLLQHYYSQLKKYPESIIMYRDGVGEGGFDEIVTREVKAIYSACSAIKPDYQAKVTFLIVQKRNHVRLFPVDPKTADRDGRLKPGTVVDSGICSPYDFDFFLCSHAGLKGTSKPTHYHVLWDENKLNPDHLLDLTYGLCHIYARCTRSVSYPAPAYYAHLAAYRARLYSDDVEDSGSDISGSTAGQQSVVIPEVSQNLKHILYYV